MSGALALLDELPLTAQNRRRRVAASVTALISAIVSHYVWWNSAASSLRGIRPTPFEYEFLPSQHAQFRWLLRHEEKFRVLCRLTIEEAEKALALMGFDSVYTLRGRWKYCPMHRFMVFLMCMADSTRFYRLSNGKLPCNPNTTHLHSFHV
jgi:hypothetical protein